MKEKDMKISQEVSSNYLLFLFFVSASLQGYNYRDCTYFYFKFTINITLEFHMEIFVDHNQHSTWSKSDRLCVIAPNNQPSV